MVDKHSDDEALSRLRSSDPATGSHPDLNHLRDLVATKAPASQGADSATRITDSHPGQRIRAPWIAAAAVAALGMGAGGYALGAQTAPADTTTVAGEDTGGGSDSAERSELLERMLAGSSSADEGFDSESAVSMLDGDAAQDDTGYGGEAWDPGPVRLFAGPDLSTEAGTGVVRALITPHDPKEFLDAWADRLDFDGVDTSDSEYSSGFSLSNFETGITLSVDTYSGALDFYYEDVYASDYCSYMFDGLSEEDAELIREEMEEYGGPQPDPALCRTVEGPAPSEEQAIASSTDFTRSLGLDPADYEYSVEDYYTFDDSENSASRYVEATLVGATESFSGPWLGLGFTVNPEGVVSAHGTVGEMAELGDYPTISAADAVARYAQREFAVDYSVYLEEEWVEWDESMPYPDYTEPERVQLQPGDPIQLLRKDKVITSAELVTGSMWTSNGSTIEVPVWKLIAEDGMYYPVMALADEAIDWQSWE